MMSSRGLAKDPALKLSQQSRKSMIKRSTRVTVAVQHAADTLIMVSLPRSEPSALGRPPRQPPTRSLLLKGGDFVISGSFFKSRCSYLLSGPDAPTAATDANAAQAPITARTCVSALSVCGV